MQLAYKYCSYCFNFSANGVAAPYSNDDRQRAVNRRAEYVGASSGTFRYDDVPGTNRDFGYGYGGYNRYNDGYYGAYNDGYYGGYNRGRYYNYGRH